MSYHHITITERCCIYQFLNSGMSIQAIAKALHRSPGTISREIARDSSQDAETSTYNPSKAESKYLDKRKKCHRKSSFTDKSILYIQDRILENWSPDQIAHRKPNATIRIPSASTIYRYIHLEKIRNISMRFLRRKGTFKRPAEKRGKFNGRIVKSNATP